MINGFLKTIASLLMLCTVVSFASCRNDGDDEELGGGTTGQPPVITFDNGTGIYTVKIMKSITITPLVNDATDPVYTWKDEKGKIVCTDLSYTYSPKAEGEVYFKFRVDAKNGYAEEELRVDVVEKMIPSVSLIPAYSTYMGKSVTLESSVNFTEGAKYEWVSIDESGKTKETVGTEATYTFTPTEEGQFSFKLTVTNEDGSGNASTSVLVSPEPVMNITFSSNQLTVPKGRAACIAPVITDTTTHATYVWEVDEVMQQGETGPTFTFTPPTTGSYVVKVTGTDGDIIKSAIQTVVCLPSDEAKYYRAPSAGSSDSKVKVYHLRPAPGQFIAQISGQTEEDCSVLTVHIGVCGAVHGSNALQRQVVVHHGEHTLLHLSAVPCVNNNLLAAGDIKCYTSLGVQTQLLVVLNLSLGCVVNYEIGLEVLQLFLGGFDEHVGYEMSLPSYLNDETDSHTGIFVCTAECINYEKSLV